MYKETYLGGTRCIDGSVAAVKDAGDSDFADALRERRASAPLAEMHTSEKRFRTRIVMGDSIGIDCGGLLRGLIELTGTGHVRQDCRDSRGFSQIM